MKTDALKYALDAYGTKAIAGATHAPEIVKYFAEIGHSWVRDDETAWCAAFVNWCLKKAGLAQTGKLNARSFLTYGTPTKTPEVGDLVVLWRIRKDGPFGHVGFYIKQTHDRVYVLGGNQSNAVNITAYDKTYLLEYRAIQK